MSSRCVLCILYHIIGNLSTVFQSIFCICFSDRGILCRAVLRWRKPGGFRLKCELFPSHFALLRKKIKKIVDYFSKRLYKTNFL